MKRISLASALVPFKAYLNIFDCLWTERIGRGKYVEQLEAKACEYFKVKHCIAVGNGTLADILVLMAMKIKVNDPSKYQVVMPALTFVAHSNAVIMAGLTPVFVDVGDDLQMDQDQCKQAVNKHTLCIFPVHLLGVECKIPKVRVPVLEDCCEAMGGITKKGKKFFGTQGIAGTFSMYPSHTITTGEGGLILSNDDEFAKLIRSLHNHGKVAGSNDFNFDHIGINAKMTNLQAAIGCAVFDTIDEVNDRREANVNLYNFILGQDFYSAAPHGYPVIYKDKEQRDWALEVLGDRGIEARKLMSCVPNLKPYKELGFGVQGYNAQRLADCGLFLPLHQRLTKQDIERICNALIRP